MKYFIGFVALIIILAGAGYWLMHRGGLPVPVQNTNDPKNATYNIDGTSVTLVNGSSNVAQDNSSAPIVTQYFGNEATGDLNGDGMPDAVFILTQTSGGSGTFYYAAADVSTPDGYRGTNAVLLGDRIAPQTTQIQNGEIIVNYADRAPTDPMTAQPSVGVSKYLQVSGTQLSEVH
ncbi:MAG TPA: hypothetical protein VG934_00785 [Candidatus Paceibacterota bacterium]|nr:hypothetical protein [Candidatus Paceibacterota bacterium]